jgi:hypothetical protein
MVERQVISERLRKACENTWGGPVPSDEEAFIEWLEREWRSDCREHTDLQEQNKRLIAENKVLRKIIVRLSGLATGVFVAMPFEFREVEKPPS